METKDIESLKQIYNDLELLKNNIKVTKEELTNMEENKEKISNQENEGGLQTCTPSFLKWKRPEEFEKTSENAMESWMKSKLKENLRIEPKIVMSGIGFGKTMQINVYYGDELLSTAEEKIPVF